MSDVAAPSSYEPLLAALLAAGSVLSLALGLWRRGRHARRQARLRMFVSGAARRGAGRPASRAVSDPLPSLAGVLAPLVSRAGETVRRLLPAHQVEAMRANLTLAGFSTNRHLVRFLAAKVVLAVAGGAAALAAGAPMGLPPAKTLLVALLGAAVGFYLPGVWLGQRMAQRRRELLVALPDALDLLTISVSAGLGFDGALGEVVQRWRNTLTDEFAAVLRDLKLGRERRDALRALALRTGLPEVSTFVAAVVQADELGVPIKEALRVQAAQLRQQRRYKAEERARKAVVKMLVPMVIFIFPSLFVVLIGPAAPSFRALVGR